MIVREKEDASFAWGKESADCVQCGIDCGDAVDSHIVLGTLTEQISTTKRGMLEYKDSKGQDCYFYYSSVAGADLDMLGYVPVADIESEVTDWSIVLLVSGKNAVPVFHVA